MEKVCLTELTSQISVLVFRDMCGRYGQRRRPVAVVNRLMTIALQESRRRSISTRDMIRLRYHRRTYSIRPSHRARSFSMSRPKFGGDRDGCTSKILQTPNMAAVEYV